MSITSPRLTPTTPLTVSTADKPHSLKNKYQSPVDKLPTDVIHLIVMECLECSDIKSFMSLGLTNRHSYKTMQKLVDAIPLILLCPELRILNAKTYTFYADVINIDKFKVMQSYYKLERYIEDRAGLTLIFNQQGLTLNKIEQNSCGIRIQIFYPQISEKLGDVPEEDTGPELITNAPITETRNKIDAVQETRVGEVGFHGKPTLISYLALMIATQKQWGTCLYAENPQTYGRSASLFNGIPIVVGDSSPGLIKVDSSGAAHKFDGSGGRLKLQNFVKTIKQENCLHNLDFPEFSDS